MAKKSSQDQSAKTAVEAAAVVQTHDDPHEVSQLPQTLDLSAEQKDFILSLSFLSEYQLAHLRKTSSDVAGAFDESTVAAIEQHAELGGKTRADRIRQNKARHDKLTAIAAIVGPIARIVGQNLLIVDGQLATDAGEPLKVAHGLRASHPDMIQKLTSLDSWSRLHHATGHRAVQQPAPSPTK
jgi:hypothetical protein